MRVDSSKITGGQLFCAALASRAAVLTSGVKALSFRASAAECALAVLAGTAILMIVKALIKGTESKRIICFADKAPLSALAVAACAVTLYFSSGGYLESLMAAYGSGALELIMLTLTAFSVVYAVKKGVEGAVRFGFAAFVISAFFLLVLVASNVNGADFGFLSPLKEATFKGVLRCFSRIYILCPEVVLFYIYAPFVKDGLGADAPLSYMMLQGAFLAFVLLLGEAVMGPKAYAAFDASALSDTGILPVIERFSSLFMCFALTAHFIKFIMFAQGIYLIARLRIKGGSCDEK